MSTLPKPKTSSALLAGLFLVSALNLPVSGIADENLAGKYYEDALVAYQKQDLDGAIIELRNALQQNPNYVAAHILLGELFLQKKSLSEAEVHINLANQMGADKSLTVKALAQLYLYQLKYNPLLKEIQPSQFNRQLQPDLHVFRGHAYLQLNQISEALDEYDMAAQIDPSRVDAVIGRANALLRRNDLAGATQAVEKAMSMQPDNAGNWYVKGSIEHVQGNLENAIKNYDKAITLAPDYQDARIARAGVLMDLHQDQRAGEDLAYLREHYPFDPKAAYLHAVLLSRNGQKEASIKELEAASDIIVAVKPEYLIQHSQTLMLSGLINYSLQRFDLAAEYLRQYVKTYPGQPGPYKLLASILLNKNDPETVIDLLRPVVASHPNDHRLLFLLGTAYMNVGKHDKANALLEKASAGEFGGESIHTEIGLNRLSMGQETLAIQELEAAIQKNPGNTQAGIPLVAIYIRNGDAQKALRIAQGMYKKQSKNLTLLNLLGTAQVATQNLKQARQSFEQAVGLAPSFITGHLNLSKLDVAEKKIDKAKQRLIKLNQEFPDNVAVLIELSTVDQAAGNNDSANQWLEKARRIDQKSMPVLLAQMDLKIKSGRALEALSIGEAAELIDRENPQLLQALARSYLAADNREKALSIYRRMADQARLNVKKLYSVARYQIQAGDYSDAIKTLKKAIVADEKHIPTQIALTEMELYHGKPVFAISRANNLLKEYPQRGFPHRLLGDIAAQDKNFSLAVTRYQTAFDLEPDTALLMKLYQSLKQTGQNQKAFELLTQWTQKHPKDLVPIAALAEELLQQGKLKAAQKHYEFLLSQYPNEAQFLNNLAYIYYSSGNSKALSYAEKAQQLAPDQASSNDTLGWILVNSGQPDQGLHYLRSAHSRMSQNPEIRYHIAVALDKLGRKEEAKQELDAALRTNLSFSGLEQAKKLLEKLSQP
ncbi:MAG: PEP-CTERM system TPR-repeat protein PrsT [Methylomonas sp.]|jgi:putative PEP-CTERM system TPR-repeat lipoprotein|uniref:XrtA/PEP-CTERM system TPR-repeat protein PrsT n=1 Tax=Methylomonas sp. TaxID=418 RepID=UPI0025EB186A|nr:XrtA/PEP-CTERM system TPR-repeat protein PrsT [Methylomonas sp.]MCK9606524.1 PEP-CTERM system TPR-repeat protein PrsT [Methylomonas sp.]